MARGSSAQAMFLQAHGISFTIRNTSLLARAADEWKLLFTGVVEQCNADYHAVTRPRHYRQRGTDKPPRRLFATERLEAMWTALCFCREFLGKPPEQPRKAKPATVAPAAAAQKQRACLFRTRIEMIELGAEVTMSDLCALWGITSKAAAGVVTKACQAGLLVRVGHVANTGSSGSIAIYRRVEGAQGGARIRFNARKKEKEARQKQVWQLRQQGLTINQIAAQLNTSPSTVNEALRAGRVAHEGWSGEDQAVIALITRMLAEGHSTQAIARAAKVTPEYVRLVRDRKRKDK